MWSISKKYWAGAIVWLLIILVFGGAAYISCDLTTLTLSWLLFLPLFVLLIRRVHSAHQSWGWDRTELTKISLAVSLVIILSLFSVRVLTVTSQLRPGASFVNAHLVGVNLRGKDLHGADFSGADLRGAYACGANLRQAKLINTNLENADLSGADLTGANLDGAVLKNTDLTGVVGITADLLANILNVSITELPCVLSQRSIRLEAREDIMKNLKYVCVGEGVEEACAYTPDEGFHPMVLLDDQGEIHIWSANILKAKWEPMALRFCELVVTVEEEAVVIETCQYVMGGSFTRYQYHMEVLLFSARTGELVANETLLGGLPDPCPEMKELGHLKSYGAHVSFESLKPWLADLVNPP